MSSSPLTILMALTSFLMLPGGSLQAVKTGAVEELLSRDEYQQAEVFLDRLPRTAEAVALRGEIEYRKGNFETASSLYTEALRMDARAARAHFGLGKLAMAKLRGKQAVQEMTRAIELLFAAGFSTWFRA